VVAHVPAAPAGVAGAQAATVAITAMHSSTKRLDTLFPPVEPAHHPTRSIVPRPIGEELFSGPEGRSLPHRGALSLRPQRYAAFEYHACAVPASTSSAGL
jgi:hypothetical protein